MHTESLINEVTRRDWEATPVTSEPLRFAVIGLGGFARRTALPAISESEYCETTVLVSGSTKKAERVATEFSIGTTITYNEFHAGTASDTYDAIYIATPNALHLEFTETAAKNGKHVICEKPMEATVDQAKQMVTACADNDVRLMVAYRMQTHPLIRYTRDIIQDRIIGDPVHVHGNFSLISIRGDRQADHWRYNQELAGGGALMDVGVYPLNTTRFVLGLNPTSVQGTTETPHTEFNGVDEHVSFLASFPEAVTGAFTASFNAARETRLQVIGSDGRLTIEPAFNIGTQRELTITRDDATVSVVSPEMNEVAEEFDYFAYHIQKDDVIEPDGIDGLIDMIAMTAVYDSAETGTRVTLETPSVHN